MSRAAIAPWTTVRVPFPYVERPVRYHRPALVLALLCPVDRVGLAWVMMITSLENAGWRGDVPITDLAQAGLRHPSLIRTAKLAIIDQNQAEAIGAIGVRERQAVESWLASYLATDPAS